MVVYFALMVGILCFTGFVSCFLVMRNNYTEGEMRFMCGCCVIGKLCYILGVDFWDCGFFDYICKKKNGDNWI